jgi:hypothetical protein
MKGQRPPVNLAKEISASHGTPTRTRVVPDKRRTACDGNYGRCQACTDDSFFQQICDEVEGTYEDKTVQYAFGRLGFTQNA